MPAPTDRGEQRVRDGRDTEEGEERGQRLRQTPHVVQREHVLGRVAEPIDLDAKLLLQAVAERLRVHARLNDDREATLDLAGVDVGQRADLLPRHPCPLVERRVRCLWQERGADDARRHLALVGVPDADAVADVLVERLGRRRTERDLARPGRRAAVQDDERHVPLDLIQRVDGDPGAVEVEWHPHEVGDGADVVVGARRGRELRDRVLLVGHDQRVPELTGPRRSGQRVVDPVHEAERADDAEDPGHRARDRGTHRNSAVAVTGLEREPGADAERERSRGPQAAHDR